MVAKKADAGTIEIHTVKQGRIKLRMIGRTPLYFNSMSSKAMRDLLIGGGKKTAAEKKEIKHNPEQEFRESVYTKETGDTYLCFPAPGVKGAMATAALETAGINKTNVNRGIFMPEDKIQIWGKPYLKMDIVRSADMNKTPDVRTRAFLPDWVAEVDIHFNTPTFSNHSITSLLNNAGIMVGIGDFRQEKGAVRTAPSLSPVLKTWASIRSCGTTSRMKRVISSKLAMEQPECADEQTAELMQFLQEERLRRAALTSLGAVGFPFPAAPIHLVTAV